MPGERQNFTDSLLNVLRGTGINAPAALVELRTTADATMVAVTESGMQPAQSLLRTGVLSEEGVGRAWAKVGRSSLASQRRLCERSADQHAEETDARDHQRGDTIAVSRSTANREPRRARGAHHVDPVVSEACNLPQ